MIRILSFAFILFCAYSLVYADHPTAGLGSGSTGPIITISAETMEQGHWGFVTRFEYANFNSFTDEELIGFAESGIEGVHSLDSLISPFFGIGYGITDDFTVSARIPYVKRTNIREAEHEEHHDGEEGEPEEEPVVHTHGDSSGIGDLILFGQYRFVNNPSSHVQATLLFGVKLPSGKDDELDVDGQLFEAEHQPGSGSTDPLFGLAVTRAFEKFSVDSSFLYTKTTRGTQDTDLGDQVHYNAAFSYRLKGEGPHHDTGEEVAQHRHYFWDITVEFNGEYQQKHEIAEETEENSGGTIIYISPGIRFTATEIFSAFFSIGFPIVQDLHGTQHETSFRTLAGIGFAF